MSWKALTHAHQLDEIDKLSATRTQVLFKHSTRCSISVMSLGRLDRSTFPQDIDFYLLDLLKYRDISNEIADRYKVYHESPQALVIKNAECILDLSHLEINMDDIIGV
jgi:bacillithiol system protein YtxJ